jgi:hypothetical protein
MADQDEARQVAAEEEQSTEDREVLLVLLVPVVPEHRQVLQEVQ